MPRSGFSVRSLTATAAVVAALTAPAPGVAAHSEGTTRVTVGCSTGKLVVWLNTEGNGAAGSRYYKLELTNLSVHSCTLTGYPGVSAVDLAGHQLGRAAMRTPSTARTITLAYGAAASAVLRIVEAGNYPPASCRQAHAAGLRVYPPGQTASKLVPFPFEACARSGPTILSVEALRSG
jgi:hypothetical protein